MPQADLSSAEDFAATPVPPRRLHRRLYPRVWTALGVLLVLLLAFLLPPLINVSRYQRRIVTSISNALGRPVHLDRVSLNLLPLPSFTLQNVVVGEDPAFGAEPILRANTVTARLRVSSLWRRRVEFGTISFNDPSVNLVHNPDGRWNLESILVQAAHVPAAPTGERHAGPAPRFPYIEATGARINLKLGQEKSPFSLVDADFALWLSDPGHWQFRLKGQPARTDTNASDTGRLQVEATLGRARTLAEVPLELHASWRSAPLGQASRVLLGRDAGLRGEMAVTVDASGTAGEADLTSHLHLKNLRRADFVPDSPLTLDVDCASRSRDQFHAFSGVRCQWPVAGTDGGIVALTGSLPDLRQPRRLDLQLGVTRIPGDTLVRWLHVASARTPPGLSATGSLNGTLGYNTLGSPGDDPWRWLASLHGLSLSSPRLGSTPVQIGAIDLHSPAPVAAAGPPSARGSAMAPAAPVEVTLPPTAIGLDGSLGGSLGGSPGGKEPATLRGSFNREGYRLELSGSVLPSRLLALGRTLPFFGDGLEDAVPAAQADTPEPVALNLIGSRSWGYAQTWTAVSPAVSPQPRSHRSSRRRRR